MVAKRVFESELWRSKRFNRREELFLSFKKKRHFFGERQKKRTGRRKKRKNVGGTNKQRKQDLYRNGSCFFTPNSSNSTTPFTFVALIPDTRKPELASEGGDIRRLKSPTPPLLPAGSPTSVYELQMGATHARPLEAAAGEINNGGAERTTEHDTSASASSGCGCLGSASARHHASQLRTLRSLERRFNRSDTNKSGGICYKEMCRTLRIEHDLMSVRLFSLLDADGNSEITFPELSAALATFSHSELDRARFAFCLYDLDGNGGGGARRATTPPSRVSPRPRREKNVFFNFFVAFSLFF